jgi:hypothetical protein
MFSVLSTSKILHESHTTFLNSFLNRNIGESSYKEVLFLEKVKIESKRKIDGLVHEVFPTFKNNSDIDTLDYELAKKLSFDEKNYELSLREFEASKEETLRSLKKLEEKQTLLEDKKYLMKVSQSVLYSFRDLTHPWFSSILQESKEKKKK